MATILRPQWKARLDKVSRPGPRHSAGVGERCSAFPIQPWLAPLYRLLKADLGWRPSEESRQTLRPLLAQYGELSRMIWPCPSGDSDLD